LKILLVYPEYPDTFWSFRYALKLISKKAPFPPLGLVTVAAMFPDSWERKLVDMNITTLTDIDLRWADYVFISAMDVQRESVNEVVARCQKLGVKTVAGGPLFTTGYDEFDHIDHLVLGEGEVTFPIFLKDIEQGCAQHIYHANEWPDISRTVIPLWSLLDMKKYSAMNVQYSRGCPYNCEFCDIIILNGHKPRTKDKQQLLAELEGLYNLGWRSGVFIVDDNFIGNKRKLKTEILPALIEWQQKRKHPFALSAESTVNLAADSELMKLMVRAGFNTVFIGIETPNEESLVECNKQCNRGRDLVASVKEMQRHGLEVQGGFIVGFDSDPLSIFKNQINFIQNSGIVTAMVGLLNAPRGTRLYQRLKRENRILSSGFSGDNTDCSINFIPKMDYSTLIEGYKHILDTIYSPRQYYERIRTFLRDYRPVKRKQKLQLKSYHLEALFKSMWYLGIKERGRRYYWKLFAFTLLKRPRLFPLSITLSVYGLHFRKIAEKYINLPIEDTLGRRASQKSRG